MNKHISIYTKIIDGKRYILSELNGKKTCIKCLVEKDISEFYKSKGPCKECKKSQKIEKSRLYYREIDGKKILLSEVNGKKTCMQCVTEKDISEYYGKRCHGICKECRYKNRIDKINKEFGKIIITY